jgi:hypothetical protein
MAIPDSTQQSCKQQIRFAVKDSIGKMLAHQGSSWRRAKYSSILSCNAEAEQNIVCMFSLTESTPKPVLCDGHLCFGDNFVLVLYADEFLNRVN